jgi:hypothetical protein
LRAATLRLDARAIFDRAVTQDIALAPDGSVLRLRSGEVVEDDGPAAGFSYKPNVEHLSSTVWIRKQLVIADPRASAAVLMVGPGGDLKISVNGRPQTLEPPRKAGYGLWQAYTINPAALKPGVNDIVMSGSGRVWIARSDDSYAELPHRSARSADAGASWSADHLGPKGDISGEYYVRILLEHYRSKGSMVLPVMDVANLTGNPLPPPLAGAGPLKVSVQAETGDEQNVSVRVRSGSTYVPRQGTWSEWAPLDRRGTLKTPRGRFVQLEVTLATGNPLDTPELRGITVETAPAVAGDWTKTVKVVDAHNEEIIRTSIPFRYEPFTHPKLKELRERYHLDDVVAGSKTELDLITKLAVWSTNAWKWGEWGLETSYPAWDALEILKKGPNGKPIGGFCQQYDLVFMQACESFGLVSRDISIYHEPLPRPDIAGHEPNEIWSNQYGKWIYVDGTSAWYAVDQATNVPLDLWELRRRQIEHFKGDNSHPIRIIELAPGVQPWRWRSLDESLGFGELRLIPRSNFLEQKSPLPLNQGKEGWFWDGHYVWTDADAPADMLQPNLVTRHGNFEWTLDQAHYVLEAGRAPGELRVHLDTETPGFETFVAEIDGAGPRPVGAVFPWKLHPGRNRLKAWPRNDAGRDGVASWIELDMPAL